MLNSRLSVYAPNRLKAQLDKHIIGQDMAKVVLSVALYNHLKRVTFAKALATRRNIEIDKSNVLLLGPSGSGKTHLIRTLAKLTNLPLVIADATSFTESGCKGNNYSTLLNKLLDAANGNLKLAERGIIFIDEIDKKTAKTWDGSSNKPAEADQHSILKLIEGTEVKLDIVTDDCQNVVINTKNILFIFGGAFVGIDKIIQERLKLKAPKPQALGLTSYQKPAQKNYNELLPLILPDDLCQFGMIPELVGRIPVICPLEELSRKDLCRILTEPENNLLHQYQKLCKLDNIHVSFTTLAIEEIANKAIAKGTGARALHSIVDKAISEIMFNNIKASDSPYQRVVVTKHDIEAIV